MQIAKIIRNGGSQAVRIPAAFRLRGNEALIKRIPGGVALLEKVDLWKLFEDGLELFKGDFMQLGRELKDKE